jgi:hypothetical protein
MVVEVNLLFSIDHPILQVNYATINVSNIVNLSCYCIRRNQLLFYKLHIFVYQEKAKLY